MVSRGFDKTRRLRRRSEFQRAFDGGYRVSSRYFTVIFTPGAEARSRLGLVASRKLGDAVRRNRAKRVIREIFRHLDPLPEGGVDVVVIPRRELFDAPFSDLERDFRAAWRRGVARLRPAHAG